MEQSNVYYNPVKIADTLQGSIWRASTTTNHTTNASTVVVKVTKKEQHKNSIAICENKVYHNVKENILLEQSILKYLTQLQDCPESIAKFVSFFKTKNEFCLVMEDGGSSLFEFVASAHNLIKSKRIEVSHWIQVVKVIFRQMVECIQFIHRHNVCHHDISLENFVINDVAVNVDEHRKLNFVMEDIQIKLVDFGLAELYTKEHCVSSKHSGKKQYYSPEVVAKQKQYDAKKNDVWCAGICLFMLFFGCAPWEQAHSQEAAFDHIMSGNLVEVLLAWDLLMYLDVKGIDLLRSLFEYEKDRMSVDQMAKHQFLR
eukprot:226725_1